MFKSAIASLVTPWVKQVPLRRVLMIPFVVPFVLAVGLMRYLSDRNSHQAIAKLPLTRIRLTDGRGVQCGI